MTIRPGGRRAYCGYTIIRQLWTTLAFERAAQAAAVQRAFGREEQQK